MWIVGTVAADEQGVHQMRALRGGMDQSLIVMSITLYTS